MNYLNNPANIRYNKNTHWQGQIGSKNGFCEFDSLEHGVRALVLILCRYIYVYKLTSVKAIISRFAPATENDTCNYISFVSSFLRERGIDPNSLKFELGDIFMLSCAICKMETGYMLFNIDMVSCSFFMYVKQNNIKLI